MAASTTPAAALVVDDLYVSFGGIHGRTRALNGVRFAVRKGQILGVVGESGCGKSLTALAAVRLLPPAARIDGGHVWLATENGALDVLALPAHDRRLRDLRGRLVSMIFQEPMRSLHPMFSIGDQLREVLQRHLRLSGRQAQDRAAELLDSVGLPQPRRLLHTYPHELSGGMRQRVMIAIALACTPQLLIADEPTTALDVTIQAQVLDLIRDLQAASGTSVMLITHDMGVVAEMADEVLVMYLGQVVEHGSVQQVLGNPLHPYTRGLRDSVPTLRSTPKTRLPSLPGTVPELLEVPAGCPFAARCAHVHERCSARPPMFLVGPNGSGQSVACWLYAPPALAGAPASAGVAAVNGEPGAVAAGRGARGPS